jgi:hypothetical protein
MEKYVEADCEQIGNSYYCIYCAEKIEPKEHYHDSGHEGTTYECTCKGIHEAIRIKNEIEKLNVQLIKLKKSAQNKLNKQKYNEAVIKAATKYSQPIP